MVYTDSFSTISQVRDARLGLMGELFDVTEHGMTLHLSGPSEFDRWHKDVLQVLAQLDRLNRLIAPLRGG